MPLMANRLTNPAFIPRFPDVVDGCPFRFSDIEINIPPCFMVFPYYGCQHLPAYPIISPSEIYSNWGHLTSDTDFVDHPSVFLIRERPQPKAGTFRPQQKMVHHFPGPMSSHLQMGGGLTHRHLRAS